MGIDSMEARQRTAQKMHLSGMGRQITSTRATVPSVRFAAHVIGPSQRCIEIVQHPAAKNPGPLDYTLPDERVASTVLKGWCDEERFHAGRLTLERTGVNIIKECYSTNADPLSPVYPYAEVRPNNRSSSLVPSNYDAGGDSL